MGTLSVGEIHRDVLPAVYRTFAQGACPVWDAIRFALVAPIPMRKDHPRPHLMSAAQCTAGCAEGVPLPWNWDTPWWDFALGQSLAAIHGGLFASSKPVDHRGWQRRL